MKTIADSDPFLSEARSQAARSRVLMYRAWAEIAAGVVLSSLFVMGIAPVLTFVLSVLTALSALSDFEAASLARTSAVLALGFRAGIEE